MSAGFGSGSLEEMCQSAVILLRDADITFLAIDFDHTFIDEHTDGKFKGNSTQLGHKIREVFRYLVPLAFQHGERAVNLFCPKKLKLTLLISR